MQLIPSLLLSTKKIGRGENHCKLIYTRLKGILILKAQTLMKTSLESKVASAWDLFLLLSVFVCQPLFLHASLDSGM